MGENNTNVTTNLGAYGNGSCVQNFMNNLNNIFAIDKNNVPKVMSFDEMEQLRKSKKISKETPIARVLDNGITYELDNDRKLWILRHCPSFSKKLNSNGMQENLPYEFNPSSGTSYNPANRDKSQA